MAVLSIKWETATRVSQADAAITGNAGRRGRARASEEAPRADKPMLVWIQHPTEEAANEKISSIVLDPDKMRVGCAYFRCIKISADDAEKDPLLAETGKKYPRMVLLSTDYDVAKVLEGKIKSGSLFGAMKKAASKSYKGSFEKSVKSMIKLLGEFDKISNELSMLDAKEKKDPKPAAMKKIAKARAELEERKKAAEEEKKKLMDLEPKAA